jgi:hypothetical protein
MIPDYDKCKDDNDWIAKLDAVTLSPTEALRLVVEYDAFLGYDHYYKDIRAAVMRAVERSAASAMTEQRAREILGDTLNAEIIEEMKSRFTADQLEAIAWWMRNKEIK